MTLPTELLVDISRCDQLVKLERSRARLEEELKRTKKGIESLWAPILSDLIRAGLKNISLKSGERLQPFRTVRCNLKGGVDSRAAVAALKAAGLDWVVDEKHAPGKLKDYIKEKEGELKEAGEMPPDDLDELIPEEIGPFFKVAEENKIVVYGAKANARKE